MLKIDKRKKYYLVIDTETQGADRGTKKTYDIGYVIIDKKGRIQKEYNALVEEIYGDEEIMSTAYYNNKIPLYDYMIDNKEVKVKKYRNIVNQIKRDLKNYNIKGIFAFNVDFDMGALVETSQYLLKDKVKLTFRLTKNKKWCPEFEKYLQKLFETKAKFYDIWTMGCMTLCQQKTFLQYFSKFTKRGNIITNAETLYQYITDNKEFKEEHTALQDAHIESEILARIFANGCKPTKQKFMPFRLVPVQREEVA